MNSKPHNIFMAFVAMFFAFSHSFSQNYLGVHSSNYAGVMGLDIQPASFVDGRFKVDINLVSANVGFFNNAQQLNTSSLNGWWPKIIREKQFENSETSFQDQFLIDNFKLGSNKKLGAYTNVQVDLLNFAFHVHPKIAIGLGVKMRSIANVEELSPEFMTLAKNGLDYADLFNAKFNDQNANISAMAWKEYKLNYGQVLVDRNEHFLKMGVGVKLLQGMASAYMYSKNMNYGLNTKDTSFLLQGDFSYGYSNNLDQEKINLENELKGSASKLGIGFDLGFVYEWRPDHAKYKYDMDGKTGIWRQDKNKYKARVGVSLLDIGGMKFRKGGYSRDFTVNENNPFDLMVFNGVDNLKEMDQKIDSLIQFDADWNEKEHRGESYFHNLPTALSLQAGYMIWKDFMVDVTGIVNLISKKNENRVRIANQITVTPSYDFAWASVHIPISYNSYSGFKAGLGTRLGPITIGITDFKSLFATGKLTGSEIYAGLRLPILYDAPKDRDNDKVSDKKDLCKDVPGVWAFKGCPDTDGDGIQDSEDACPTEFGLKEFNGCPDRDNDGIIDSQDACPDDAGLAEFNGCPDTDGDKIIDKEDECPTEFGLKEFNGCPDADGDGIPDKDDACPTVAGPMENNGCPDTDGDGVLDFLDECPTVAGPSENNGCPWPDTDGDGILDKDDKCPTIPGPAKNFGCPYQDTDNDGVIDSEDECPNTPGPASNKGCPEIEEEVKEILKTAFDNLEFETGKDVIKESSKPSLDELATVLIKRPEWRLQIAGHTDNVGNAQSNLILSKKRAEAVMKYLMTKEVAEKQFHVLYFGQTNPIADNSTAEGRQKNRRVEMKIIFE